MVWSWNEARQADECFIQRAPSACGETRVCVAEGSGAGVHRLLSWTGGWGSQNLADRALGCFS